jgi:hypothetical protein
LVSSASSHSVVDPSQPDAAKQEAKLKLIDKLQRQMQSEERDHSNNPAMVTTTSTSVADTAVGPSTHVTNSASSPRAFGNSAMSVLASVSPSPSAENTITRTIRREVQITLTMEKELEQERESVREKERLVEEVLNERKRLMEKISLEKKLGVFSSFELVVILFIFIYTVCFPD